MATRSRKNSAPTTPATSPAPVDETPTMAALSAPETDAAPAGAAPSAPAHDPQATPERIDPWPAGWKKRARLSPGAAFLTAAGDAIRFAGETSRPSRSIHELRKSCRRARAVLRLVGTRLSAGKRESIRIALRDAARAVSQARDHDILADAVKLLGAASEDEKRLARAIRRAVVPRAGSREDAERALGAAAAQLDGIRETLDGVQPDDLLLSGPALRRAFRASWRRARRAAFTALASGQIDDLHTWRKRMKELRYQLEALAPTGLLFAQVMRDELVVLLGQLGEITDLAVLREKLDAFAPEGDPRRADAEAWIAREIESRVSRLAPRARVVLDPGGRAFTEALLP